MPGLDGTGKMGKSEGNTLNLSDTPDEMWDKLKVAVTDTNRVRRKDPGNPSKCKIFSLHTMVSSDEQMTWAAEGCRSAGIGCFDCKKVLHENLVSLLTPFQERRAEVAEKKGYVEEILHEGGKQARKVVAETTARAREAMGIDVY